MLLWRNLKHVVVEVICPLWLCWRWREREEKRWNVEISYLSFGKSLEVLETVEGDSRVYWELHGVPVFLITTCGSMKQVNRTLMVVLGSFILSYVSKGCLEHLRMQWGFQGPFIISEYLNVSFRYYQTWKWSSHESKKDFLKLDRLLYGGCNMFDKLFLLVKRLPRSSSLR